jgi:putative ABC transport system permease protein
MDRATAKELLNVEGVDVFLIDVEPESRANVARALKTLCEEHGLLLESFAEIRSELDAMVGGVSAALWALLALGLVVAAFGIANTISMNVLEQTRELGMLRLIGMTRRQIRRLILCQAAILAIAGLIPGALVGMALGYLMILSSPALLGRRIEFVFHPTLAIGCVVAAFVIVVAASFFPAEHAARLDLAAALHYE